MSKEAVGKKLLHYRSLRGLTQSELAKRSGVGSRTIQQIEYGRGGKRETLLKIAAALGIGVDQLDESAALPSKNDTGSPDPMLNQISKLTRQIEGLQETLRESRPQLDSRSQAVLDAYQAASEEMKETVEAALGLRPYRPQSPAKKDISEGSSAHKRKA